MFDWVGWDCMQAFHRLPPYPNYEDIARFEYGRRMWKRPVMRARLLAHWTDLRHPYRERLAAQRALIEKVLNSTDSAAVVDADLRLSQTSLRCVAREIPPVFGSYFAETELISGAKG